MGEVQSDFLCDLQAGPGSLAKNPRLANSFQFSALLSFQQIAAEKQEDGLFDAEACHEAVAEKSGKKGKIGTITERSPRVF